MNVELTTAQMILINRAFTAYRAVIGGEIDGKRRVPWDHFAMDLDEGLIVPAELTEEDTFRSALNATEEVLESAYPGSLPD